MTFIPKKAKGFNATAYQVAQGYRYFRGVPIPGDMPFATAGNGLVTDYGIERVRAVVTAIEFCADNDEVALSSAKKADDVFNGRAG